MPISHPAPPLSVARMGTLKIPPQNMDDEKEDEDPLNVSSFFTSPHPKNKSATLHSWQKSIEFSQFIEAAGKGKLDIVSMALETNSEWTDRRDFLNANETALMKASYKGHLHIVELLVLTNKADMNLSNDENETALYKACDAGHDYLVEFLLTHGSAVDQPNKGKWSPLCEAARSGHLTVVELLIQHGADINVAASDGKTPLYFAAANGQLLVLKCLIAKGADVNKATDEGFTPLCRAAKEGYTVIVELLILYRADIHQATKSGQTPLHVAAEMRSFSAVRTLLLQGDTPSCLHPFVYILLSTPTTHTLCISPPHTPFPYGTYPMPPSPIYPHSHILLPQYTVPSSGANTDAIDKAGKRPIDVAKDDLIREMLQEGKTNKLYAGHLLADAGRGDMSYVRLAVDVYNVDVNCKSHKGSTPLLLAASDGQLEVVEFLCMRDADINAVNVAGYTALSSAVENGHTDIVEYLIVHHEADVEKFPKEVSSLIELAVNEGHTATAECLVREAHCSNPDPDPDPDPEFHPVLTLYI